RLEEGQEAVAHRLDLESPEGSQRLADQGVVGRDDLQPAAVAELGGHRGGADDVGEEDGADPAAGAERRRLARLARGGGGSRLAAEVPLRQDVLRGPAPEKGACRLDGAGVAVPAHDAGVGEDVEGALALAARPARTARAGKSGDQLALGGRAAGG